MKFISAKIVDESVGSINYFSFLEDEQVYKFDYPCISHNKCTPYEATFLPGVYLFECWGASGGACYETPGYGSYVRGTIFIKRKRKLYLFIGAEGKGEKNTDTYTFNGGGYSGSEWGTEGGGATDIRTLNSFDFDGLQSRIIVAAGGGGATLHYHGVKTISGNGGTLIGINGKNNKKTSCEMPFGYIGEQIPANQTNPGSCDGDEALFGIGGSGFGGGGGGGYYGGAPGINVACIVSTGGGGSSYISGHEGCNSISRSSTNTSICHTGSSFHYSGLYFESTLMKSGSEPFISPSNTIETGHKGNGFIRITYLMSKINFSCKMFVDIQLKYAIYITNIIIIHST